MKPKRRPRVTGKPRSMSDLERKQIHAWLPDIEEDRICRAQRHSPVELERMKTLAESWNSKRPGTDLMRLLNDLMRLGVKGNEVDIEAHVGEVNRPAYRWAVNALIGLLVRAVRNGDHKLFSDFARLIRPERIRTTLPPDFLLIQACLRDASIMRRTWGSIDELIKAAGGLQSYGKKSWQRAAEALGISVKDRRGARRK